MFGCCGYLNFHGLALWMWCLVLGLVVSGWVWVFVPGYGLCVLVLGVCDCLLMAGC